MSIDDINLLIPHQANIRIIQMVQKKLGLSNKRVFSNIDRYGNTTAASIPIALCEALDQNRIKPEKLFYADVLNASWEETKEKYLVQVGR